MLLKENIPFSLKAKESILVWGQAGRVPRSEVGVPPGGWEAGCQVRGLGFPLSAPWSPGRR